MARYHHRARDTLKGEPTKSKLRLVVLRDGSRNCSKGWKIGAKRGKRILGEGEHWDRASAERLAIHNAETYVRETELHLHRLMYQTGIERGFQTEESVFQALQRVPRPRWILSIREGTESEDHQGIDLVAELQDVGRVDIQIKSSQAGVEKFLDSDHDSSIVVIKISDRQDNVSICTTIVKTLSQRRLELLRPLAREIMRREISKLKENTSSGAEHTDRR